MAFNDEEEKEEVGVSESVLGEVLDGEEEEANPPAPEIEEDEYRERDWA